MKSPDGFKNVFLSQERTLTEAELINPDIVRERMNNPEDPIYHYIDNAVKLVCSSSTYGRFIAEDLEQEMALFVWGKINRFHGNEDGLRAWIYKVTKNNFLNHLTSAHAKKRGGGIVEEELKENLSNDVATEQYIIDRLDNEKFWNFLGSHLAPGQFTLLEMCYKKDLTYKQIAQKLGVHESLMKRRFLAIYKVVRKLLGEKEASQSSASMPDQKKEEKIDQEPRREDIYETFRQLAEDPVTGPTVERNSLLWLQKNMDNFSKIFTGKLKSDGSLEQIDKNSTAMPNITPSRLMRMYAFYEGMAEVAATIRRGLDSNQK